MTATGMRVIRVFHSGVVSEWRQRDRDLVAAGVDLCHVSSVSWDEGGKIVSLVPGADSFVVGARTLGHHPYAFVYDPRPLWRAMRARRLDVLDVHEEPASLAALELLVIASVCQRGVPVLFYGAQNIEKRFPVPFRWIERWALRRAAGIYCCNAEAGEIFRRKGFRGTLAVIPLGVDLDRFSPSAAPLPDRPFRIGYVGRIERRKGVFVLLDVMSTLGDGFELHFYGSGPDEADARRYAGARGMGDRVVFHGFVAHTALPETYRGVHVVAVPSQTTAEWVEQFGRVVIEAMASGVPVVGSESGSLPEVIGAAGIVVAETDVSAWAAAFEDLSSSEQHRRELASAGLERSRTFSWTSVAAAHLALYEQVAK